MSPQANILIEDFSKGLDLVSSTNTIQPGFTSNAKNFRISEYGGIEKVLGYELFATAGGDVHELSTYAQRDGSPNVLVAALSTSWQSINSVGTVATIRSGMTACTDTSFVTHEELLYGLDPKNNIATWDGTTLTSYAPGANTGPPKGIILGIWQNRLWVAKANASGDLTLRVEYSEPASPTTGFVNSVGLWPTDNFTELGGSGQSEKITGGMPTADGLVVFTTGSTYLIYETDGAFRVVDPERGCLSRKSLARIDDNIYGVTKDGVFATNGAFPLQLVSRRVDPLFRDESPTLTQAAGVRWGGSYLASYQRGATANDLTLDVTPTLGSIMAHDYPSYGWANSSMTGAERLYFIDASNKTKIHTAFSGGSFNGTPIACYYETPFNNFGIESQLKRLQRVRLVGRGALQVSVKVDNSSHVTDAGTLDFPDAPGSVWNSASWNTATFGGYETYEGWVRVQARGRRFALLFAETSSDTGNARELIDFPSSSDLGSAGVYLIEPRFTTSSRSR